VLTITALTSGRLSNVRKSSVTKSALSLSLTNLARSGFFSAMPIQPTWGWRIATSPRNKPTLPAPTMARPIFFASRSLISALPHPMQAGLSGHGQGDWHTGLSRQVGSHIDLHDSTSRLRGN